MSARDAIESLLERQVTPTQLAHQLMSFFTGRLEISRPELTRLALGLSLSNPEQPELESEPAAVYEAFKASERSIAIRIRVLFGDGTWRLWASLIRLHAVAPLVDRELIDRFIRHWERGLVLLRRDWEMVRSTDALLGRLLRKATEAHTGGAPISDVFAVTTRACSWKAAASAPKYPAETGQILITTKHVISTLSPSHWRPFTLPTPTRLPLQPFVCHPNELPAQATVRIFERLQLAPTRAMRHAFQSQLEQQRMVDLDALGHGIRGDETPDHPSIAALTRLHLFGSSADGEVFDIHRAPWSIDLSALAPSRRTLVVRAIGLGIETLAHGWQAVQPSDKLRVIVFADEEACRSLPHKDDRRLGIAWRKLQT